jgi:DNA-binding NtrC family response regulator
VGEVRIRRADVRLVAASAEDLATRERDGRLRGDLFEALGSLRIEVPPLRARRGDVPEVASALLAELDPGAAEPALRLSAGALAALARRDFPGNQRELRSLLERLAEELGRGARVTPLDLARVIPAPEPEPESYSEAVRTFKRQLVANALEHASGNRTEAARILELHPSNLIRLMRNLEIETP